MEPLKPFKPLKPAEGYGRYEFDDLDEVIDSFVSELLESEGAVAIEPKWDGVRLVVHFDGETVAAYTEDKQRDRAEILPALVDEIRTKFAGHSLILDGEILLGRIVDGKFMPVMRPDMMKIVVGKEPITEPIRYMVFDLLYLDGDDLSDLPLRERRAKLEELFRSVHGLSVLHLTEQIIAKTPDEAKQAIESMASQIGSEGAMIKSLEAPYELDGRTTSWAKYKRWKSLKCLIIGISKVFPPNTDPDEWRSAFKQSRTYIFRCAVYGPDGKTLVPIETKRTLTESDLQLRYVRAGEEDPVTGNVATKSEWRGRDDPRLWEMDERFGHREPGDWAYGQTYAIKVEDEEPQLGQVVEVAPIALNWFEDEEGYVHLTWMHPRVLRVGVDDPTEVARWNRVIELILASGQEAPAVTVVDGKLRKTDSESHKTTAQQEYEQLKILPRIVRTFGAGLTRSILHACYALMPKDYKIFVDLFAGITGSLLRIKPRRAGEREILIDIDPFIVATLRTIASGQWRLWREKFDFRPNRERWEELREKAKSGQLDDADELSKAFAFVYATLYSAKGYGFKGSFNTNIPDDWQSHVKSFFDRCELWEQRLKPVEIYEMDAFEALKIFDSEETFFFADPPWLIPQKPDRNEPFYHLGWTEQEHQAFLDACANLRGKILIVNRGMARSFANLSDQWRYRVLTYDYFLPPFIDVAEDVELVDADKRIVRGRIYFIGNYDLPEIPEHVREAALKAQQQDDDYENALPLPQTPTAGLHASDEEDESVEDSEDRRRRYIRDSEILPRFFREAFGAGLPRHVLRACYSVMPDDYDTYVELFAGPGGGLLRIKERKPGETEILVDIDPFIVAFLKTVKSGEWRKLRRYRWNPNKEYWHELADGVRSGEFDDAPLLKKAYVFAYLTFYSRANIGARGSYSTQRRYYWLKWLDLFFDRCALWEKRLKGVRIYCMDALEAMQRFDSRRTFFFADPPWVVPSTYRGEKPFYQYAWTLEDHERFIEACRHLKGKILIINQAFAKKFTAISDNWTYRVFRYDYMRVPWANLPENIEKAERRGWYRHTIYLIGNYELPEIPRCIREKALAAKLNLEEDEELTHEEQREEEERRLGDPYKIVHDVKHYDGGYEFVYMRHYRGLWSDVERQEIRQMLKAWRKASGEEREQIWNELVKEYGVYRLTVDFDDLREKAQKASDKREDVSKVIERLVSQDLPEDDLSIDDLEGIIVNIASVHGDLRIVNPASPKTQLIGWTLATPAVAMQFLDGSILPVLRDKFLNYQEGDRIVAIRKARQPKVWLTVVTSDEPELWAPPGAAGATKGTWAMFEWKANGVAWFGIQRPDYHEMWLLFEEQDDDVETPSGKWVVRLLRGEGPKVGDKGEYWQFWYPERDGQLPYVLTHTPEQAKREWKGRKYDYVILNLDVVPIVLEVFPHLQELLEGKRKAQRMLEELERWKELEFDKTNK